MKWMAAAALAGLALATVSAPSASFAASAPRVTAKQPAPGLRLQTYFPTLSASIDPAPRESSLHVFLDGRDVSNSMSLSGGNLQYVPRERVSPGWHDVFLEGTGTNGEPFSDSWAFQTAAPDFAQTAPAPDFKFFPSGGTTFFPGRFMHFFLIAPGGGFATLQFCGLGAFPFTQVPFSPVFFVTVPVPELEFNPFLNCQIQAAFTPIGGFSPFFIPLPIAIGIFSDRRHAVMSGQLPTRTTLPVFRRPETVVTPRRTMPVFRSVPMPGYPTAPVPVYRTAPAPVNRSVPMPVYRTAPAPVNRSVPMPVYRTAPMPLPRTAVPGGSMPIVRPRCC